MKKLLIVAMIVLLTSCAQNSVVVNENVSEKSDIVNQDKISANESFIMEFPEYLKAKKGDVKYYDGDQGKKTLIDAFVVEFPVLGRTRVTIYDDSGFKSPMMYIRPVGQREYEVGLIEWKLPLELMFYKFSDKVPTIVRFSGSGLFNKNPVFGIGIFDYKAKETDIPKEAIERFIKKLDEYSKENMPDNYGKWKLSGIGVTKIKWE